MGYLGAREMARFVDLDVALDWHLSGNCYPPFPRQMAVPAKRAIELARSGEWDAVVTLPDGITNRAYGSEVPVRELVESLHLDAFVDEDEDEDERDG